MILCGSILSSSPPQHLQVVGRTMSLYSPPRCQRVCLSVVAYALGPLGRPLGSRRAGLGSEELCMYTTLCTSPAVWRVRRQSPPQMLFLPWAIETELVQS
ncbi:unnamed protein product [Arctogadus glacialis]